MLYTEWLRVRGTLKWIAIVLGILVLICGIARIATFRYDAMAFIHGVQSEPDSKTTVTTLPDGTKRTVIVNDRKQIHATIDDHGYDGEHIDVVEHRRQCMPGLARDSNRLVIGLRCRAFALVQPAAQPRRHRLVSRAVFPGQRLMRLEFLHDRMDAPGLRHDPGWMERANRRTGAFRRSHRDPQRFGARRIRRTGKILGHDADAWR